MADVGSKQQTAALFLSATVTRTRRYTELTKQLTNLMGNLCCAREHSVQFFVQSFYTVKLYSLTWGVWGPLGCTGPFRRNLLTQTLAPWVVSTSVRLSLPAISDLTVCRIFMEKGI